MQGSWLDKYGWMLVPVTIVTVIVPMVLLSAFFSDKPSIIPIVSLRQNDSLSFVLGSGGTSPTYYSYARNPDGSFRLVTYPARDSSIFQDQATGSFIEAYPWHFPRPIYRFHVPDDTIIEQFSVR